MKISKMKLAIAMSRIGINFGTLAGEANVSKATLSYVNNGKACKPETVHRLAKALNVDVEYLIEQEVR